jgi:hypothetical protein
MPQEIALVLIKKHPHLCLNTLQIKRHLKYLEPKENKNHENICISLENNEHSFDNVLKLFQQNMPTIFQQTYYHLI